MRAKNVRFTDSNSHTVDDLGSTQNPKPIERYIQVLEVVASSSNGLTLSEIAEFLELPKPTAHRLVNTLVEIDGLSTEEGRGRKFRIGRRMWRILQLGLAHEETRSFAQVVLDPLSQTLGETTYVVRLGLNDVRSIAQSIPDQGYRLHVVPGDSLPMHAAASAKAILAFQSQATIEQMLKGPLDPLTRWTKTDPSALYAELAEVRRLGFAVCDREIDDSVMAFACPITIDPAGTFYSIGVTGPVNRLKRQPREHWVLELQRAAIRLSRMFEGETKLLHAPQKY